MKLNQFIGTNICNRFNSEARLELNVHVLTQDIYLCIVYVILRHLSSLNLFATYTHHS